MTLYTEIKKAGVFYSLYALFVLALGVMLLLDSKADLHLQMTSLRSSFADVFFTYYTQVGEWVPYAIAGLLLFVSFRNAALILASQIVSGLLSKLLKYMFNEPRPMLYFQEHYPDVKLNMVHGVSVHLNQSFPSGHTVTAFALFGMLVLFGLNKRWQLLCFVLALLVGVSRIYLQQHFAVDVLAGSVLGVFSALLVNQYRSYIFKLVPSNRDCFRLTPKK